MKHYHLKIFSDVESKELDFDKKVHKKKIKLNFIEKVNWYPSFTNKVSKNFSSHGSTIYVQLEGEVDSIQIAMKEFREKKIPFKIRRYYPDGSFIDYKINEFYDTLDF